MSITYVSKSHVADAADGMFSPYDAGDVWINTDGSRFVTREGKWRVEPPTFVHPMGAEPQPPSLFTEPSFTQLFNELAQPKPLARTLPDSVFSPPTAEIPALRAAPSAPHWTEPSTCRGILRALKEATQKLPPSKPLIDAIEHASIALMDYDKALTGVTQDGWNHSTPLEIADSSLAYEIYTAVSNGKPFVTVAFPCHRAIEAVGEAVDEIKAAEKKSR